MRSITSHRWASLLPSISRVVRGWVMVVGLAAGGVVSAQTTVWTAGSGDWLTPGNWDNGVPSASTTVIVDNGGTASLAGTGAASVVAVGNSGTGALTFASGTMTTLGYSLVGIAASAQGTLTVSGGNWINGTQIEVGVLGTGSLTITGGTVTDDLAWIGTEISGVGVVTVSGGQWIHVGPIPNQAFLSVGQRGTGTLIITGGLVANETAIIGAQATGHGTVTVSGGEWNTSAEMTVGFSGTGALTVSGAGVVSADTVVVARQGGGTGAITVAGTAGSRGTLATSKITKGVGSGGGGLDFDGGILRATADQNELFVGFGVGEIRLLSGGAWLDTSGHTVGISNVLQGSGGLAKLGAGTLTLSGASTYTGVTSINGGTLALGVAGSIGNSSAVQLAGGGIFDISATGFAVGAGRTLGGSGTVVGAVTNAGTVVVAVGESLTFSGAFASTGTLTVDGGSLMLANGANLTSGTLNVNGSPSDRGMLITSQISKGVGSAAINFNGGSLRAIANEPTLLSGFEPGYVQLLGGGVFFDTNGFSVGIATVLQGVGGLTKLGSGILTLSGANVYVGDTVVSAGTLTIGVGGSLTSSGLVLVANGATLDFAGTEHAIGAVTNDGTVTVAAGRSVTLAGALTNTGNATVSGQLYFNGGGTSTGPIALAGGIVGFGSTTFNVPNAATSITGSGGLIFAAGTTTLDYGISNAPLTFTQSVAFSGGTLALPGATSLRASVLALANDGQSPDLPTTVLAGGTFIWNSGSVRNTLTLEAGVKSTDTGWDTVNFVDPSGLTAGVQFGGGQVLDGTLINRTATLSFQAVAGSYGFGGSGTLRNEGAVSINTLASIWSPTIENVGAATLAGHFSTVNNADSLTFAASGVETQITTLTQTAGTTTFSGFQDVSGQTWDIQAGSTLATPDGAWLTVGSFTNAGTLDFTGPTTVVNPMQNLAGGVVHITHDMQTIAPFLLQNQGTIILDGPLAKLWILISGYLGDTGVLSSEQLTTIAGGTLEIRNGANLTLSNGLGGAANLVVGNGSTLSQTNGSLSGPGTLTIQSGGTMNFDGGIWGGRAISNAGIFNAGNAYTLTDNTAGTFDNLAGGVINLNGSSQFISAGGTGSSVTLTNAAGATIRKNGGSANYDLIYGSGTFVNHGLVEVLSGTGYFRLSNFTNDGTLRVAAGTEMWMKDGTLQAGSTLDGAGTYRLREGTVTLGAGLNLAAKDLWLNGSVITGAGDITVRNGDSLRLDDGIVNGPGALAIQTGGTMAINGGGTWGGRAISNAGTFNANGALNLTNGTALTFENTAGGVINLNGGYQFINAAGTGQSVALTNAAGATISRVGNTLNYDLIYGNGTIVNHGLVEVLSGTGYFRLSNFTSDGTLRAAAGTEMWLKDGTLQAGSTLDGAGTYRLREGTVTLGAGLSLAAKDLWMDGSLITGAGNITVRNGDTLRQTNGTLSGPGALTIQSGGTMNFDGGIWGGRAISNAGTFNANNGYSLTDNTAGIFDNLSGGVLNLNGGYQFISASGTGQSVALTNAAGATISRVGNTLNYDLIYGNGTIVNHGLVEVLSGTGYFRLSNFTSDGTLRAAAGTEMWLKDGTLQAGSTLDGAGTYRLREGTVTLGAGLNLSAKDLWLNGSVITGAGDITVRNGDSLRLDDGIVNGPGALAIQTGGTMAINGGGTWGGRAISNAGAFNANGALNLTNGTALTFENTAGGVINLNGGYQFINSSGTGQSVALTNAAGATIRKIGGPDQYDLIYGSGTFVNHGTVEVNSGSLRTVVGLPGGQLTEGTWRVTDGARLNLNSDAAITQNAATVVLTGANSVFNGLNSLTNNTGSLSLLGGRAFTTSAAMTNSGTLIVGVGSSFATSSTFANSGALNVTGSFSAGGGLTNSGTLGGSGTFTGSLISSGTLSPGNSPGLLSITGDLTLLSSSLLSMELGGLGRGVSYDGIDVSGIMTLNGDLSVVLINGFSPVSGASFNLLDASSLNGTFSSTSLPTLTTGLSWDTSALYTSGFISVSGTAVPEPSTYAVLAGLGALGLAMWRRRKI